MIYLGPEPRDPLAVLDADPRVTVSSSASYLDAEGRDEQ